MLLPASSEIFMVKPVGEANTNSTYSVNATNCQLAAGLVKTK